MYERSRNVCDLVTFRRLLALLTSRHGQILNKTDLLLRSVFFVPTIGLWLQILESTDEIMFFPHCFENLGERIRSPKVYWGDSGLACYLLGIRSASELERSRLAQTRDQPKFWCT
jgi:uncharacterized protein